MTAARTATDDRLDPIAGVTLSTYAEINVHFAHSGYDTSVVDELAAKRGISQASWREAVAGWNRRITEHRQVAATFERLYAAAADSIRASARQR